MSQSRFESLVEAKANLIAGFVFSFLINRYVGPLLGIPMNNKQAIGLVLIFTVLSLVRQYIFRRMFNRFQERREAMAMKSRLSVEN